MLNDPTSTHRHAWELIPWLVNGTAADSDRQIAETHIRGCSDCREELAFQQQLRDGLTRQPTPEGEPQAGWQLLRARLNATVRAENGTAQRGRRVRRPAWSTWLVAAVIVQAVGLGALGLALFVRSGSAPAAAYRTLSAPELVLPAGSVRAVFAPQTSVGQLQGLLARAGLRVLSGPGVAGVWTLGPTDVSGNGPKAASQALRILRANPAVRFAVAVDGSP